MLLRYIAFVLAVFLPGILMPLAAAELSGDQAAIVNGNESTVSFIAEQDYEAALRSAETTYKLSLQTLGNDAPTTANLAVTYARLLGATGSLHTAYDLYASAVGTLEKRYGENSIEIVPALLGMGEFEDRDKQPALVRRALNILRSQTPDDAMSYADAALLAGEYLAKHRKNRKFALGILKEAFAIYRKEYGEGSVELIQPLMLLGNASARYGKSGRPKTYYRQALNIAKKKLSADQHAELLLLTGRNLLQYSSTSDGRIFIRNAYQKYLKLNGRDHPSTAVAGLSMAQYHLGRDKPHRALPILNDALSALENEPNYRNYHMVALSLLVESYERQGRREEATPYCQAIGKIAPWADTQDYKPIFKKPPLYWREIYKAGAFGYVVLEFTVDEHGFVKDPRVADSEGPVSFHTAALQAINSYRYAPAFTDGKPVSTSGVRERFNFRF